MSFSCITENPKFSSSTHINQIFKMLHRNLRDKFSLICQELKKLESTLQSSFSNIQGLKPYLKFFCLSTSLFMLDACLDIIIGIAPIVVLVVTIIKANLI